VDDCDRPRAGFWTSYAISRCCDAASIVPSSRTPRCLGEDASGEPCGLKSLALSVCPVDVASHSRCLIVGDRRGAARHGLPDRVIASKFFWLVSHDLSVERTGPDCSPSADYREGAGVASSQRTSFKELELKLQSPAPARARPNRPHRTIRVPLKRMYCSSRPPVSSTPLPISTSMSQDLTWSGR